MQQPVPILDLYLILLLWSQHVAMHLVGFVHRSVLISISAEATVLNNLRMYFKSSHMLIDIDIGIFIGSLRITQWRRP